MCFCNRSEKAFVTPGLKKWYSQRVWTVSGLAADLMQKHKDRVQLGFLNRAQQGSTGLNRAQQGNNNIAYFRRATATTKDLSVVGMELDDRPTILVHFFRSMLNMKSWNVEN